MYTLLFSILGALSWHTLFEIPAEGRFRDVFMDETGDYHVVMSDQGAWQEITYNSDGMEIGRTELPEQADPALLYNLILLEKEGYGSFAALQCTSSEDTLFTTVLGDASYSAELPGMELPAEDGGCYVTYTPAQAEGHWKLYRLNSEGEILFDNGYALSGGPMISINDMVELPEGGVVLTGVTDDCGMNLFMILLGYDGAGNVLFYHRESLRFHGSGELLETNDAGEIYLCGITGDERDDGFFMPPADTDVFLDCRTETGNLIWREELPLPLSNWPVAMHAAHDGSVVLIVSSQREDGEGERRYFLASCRED